MTSVSALWLAVAAAAAVGDWGARLRSLRRLEYLCKPATLVALVVVAATVSPGSGAGERRWLFVAALGFSLVGDVVLMLPSELFVAGLGAFLLAHLLYLAGFWVRGPGPVALVVAAVVVVAPFALGILRALRRRRALRRPVALYMIVISAMAATALATGNPVAGVGAVLFVASDTMIAWNRFVRPFRAADVGIMVTYHLGQAALVLSLLR
ncbi:MAG: lysoplasmalogenase [Acidimicrobiales bacterium]